MYRGLLFLSLMTLVVLVGASRDDGPNSHGVFRQGNPLTIRVAAQDFRPLPFHELAKRVDRRYRGRLIGADIAPPTPQERELGAALVYEFRLMTPQRHLLLIRMDARNGRFLEVAGRGQLAALRRDPRDDDDDNDFDED
jgi:hypothetical protein